MKQPTKQNVGRKHSKRYICLGLFGIALVLLVVAYKVTLAPPAFDPMAPCVFCDIVAQRTQTTIEVETDEYVIFRDIKPASTHHYLCVTKRHIESLKTMTRDDIPLVNRMEASLKEFCQSKGIDIEDALFGFHMPPFISVRHLHMHAISPRSTMSWMSSFIFMPSMPWFKQVEDARKYLENKTS